MPELPEVETVRRGLAPVMAGQTIVQAEIRRPNLRFPFPPDFAKRLNGRRIVALGRRAKYLLADLDSGDVLVMHLGMSGSFRVVTDDSDAALGRFHYSRSTAGKHDHVLIHLSNDQTIIYNDPRRFGFMELVPRAGLQAHPLFAKTGIEPLGNELDDSFIANAFRDKKAPLKAALLDQRMIAGLGNIYVCEALHRAGLSPRRMAGSIVRKNGTLAAKADGLAQIIRGVLQEAVAAGGSTLRDHRLTDGSLGYFQHNFRVYDREGKPCPSLGCTGTVKRIVQSGRSTFFCSVCQK